MRQGVTDGLGKLALLTDQAKFCLVRSHSSRARRVADFSAAGRRDVRRCRATDVPLDGIERGDLFQRLAGNRRKFGSGEFVEVALDVGPVRCQSLSTFAEVDRLGAKVNLTKPKVKKRS